MKDTIKVGDAVVRQASKQTSWWQYVCEDYGFPVDRHYIVTVVGDEMIQLQEFDDTKFAKSYFDLVELTPEQEYEQAKKLIGKTVKFKDRRQELYRRVCSSS